VIDLAFFRCLQDEVSIVEWIEIALARRGQGRCGPMEKCGGSTNLQLSIYVLKLVSQPCRLAYVRNAMRPLLT